jgi:hypothetical protein
VKKKPGEEQIYDEHEHGHGGFDDVAITPAVPPFTRNP